jgi:hypothetical protein
MRVLFDQATPVPIRSYLIGHEVRTAAQQGWDTLQNGELLLLTTDKNTSRISRPEKSRS